MSTYDNFLKRNNISESNIHNILYEQILLKIFERLCKRLKNENETLSLKSKLRKAYSPAAEIQVYRAIISCETKLSLSDEEILFISKLIKAFWEKSSDRIQISPEERKKLLKLQNYQCNYCGCDITNDNHVDHIIPFKFTGDELNDNYQCLCSKCNLLKGARMTFLIDMICDGKIH